jgi:hypothetical protein
MTIGTRRTSEPRELRKLPVDATWSQSTTSEYGSIGVLAVHRYDTGRMWNAPTASEHQR